MLHFDVEDNRHEACHGLDVDKMLLMWFGYLLPKMLTVVPSDGLTDTKDQGH